jgi:diphthamide biosynthesis protein 4
MKDLYRVLNIDKEIKPSTEQIKRKYLELVQLHHPDKQDGCNDDDMFIQIQQAYEILRDTKKRKAYDEEYERYLYATNKTSFGEVSEFINISEMEFLEEENKFSWSCRCGSSYDIESNDVDGEHSFQSIIVGCRSCSLKIKVVNDLDDEDDEVTETE